jgi:hypothetical protein
MNIDGTEYIKADEAVASEESGPWEVGKIYHVRTVTFAIAGKLAWVGEKELLFIEASWIADSGRFSNYLKGEADDSLEVEPFHKKVIVGRGAVVDATIIDDFKRDQK